MHWTQFLIAPRTPHIATRSQFLELLVAYFSLLGVCYEARERGDSPSCTPFPCRQLLCLGIGKDSLLWMLYQGHVLHCQAVPWTRGQTRWITKPSTMVEDDSAFALTPLGEAFGDWLIGKFLFPQDNEDFVCAWSTLQMGALTPGFDLENRVLAWGRHIVKSYRQPSANQELILLAAEEMGWVEWFDDPLPRGSKGNPKVRLHDTIKNLNRHQNPHLVQFKGNGTGTRIGWGLL